MGGRRIDRVLAARLGVDRDAGTVAGEHAGTVAGEHAGTVAGEHAGTVAGRRPEMVLVEEPLAIRFGDVLVATTMRTPGHDFELAAGWCLAEGLLGPVDAPARITDIRYCGTGSALDSDFNTVTVTAPTGRPVSSPRLGTISSSCGICGAEAVDALVDRLAPLPTTSTVRSTTLLGSTDAVRGHQRLFESTGGSHAAAALDETGEVLVVREDIGRHNAADQVVGRLLLDGRLPLPSATLWISGRASFEMVQKAWSAGFAALVSVSAPSSLAVTTAERAGLVLAGFTRAGRTTVYSGLDRVVD